MRLTALKEHYAHANMHEKPLRLVPPSCVAFVFFGPIELVRCRASSLQVVSHASTLSILERASYKRQRSKETGKPFLLLSVYHAADIATIVKQGTVPFVQRCNEALQHRVLARTVFAYSRSRRLEAAAAARATRIADGLPLEDAWGEDGPERNAGPRSPHQTDAQRQAARIKRCLHQKRSIRRAARALQA